MEILKLWEDKYDSLGAIIAICIFAMAMVVTYSWDQPQSPADEYYNSYK